MEKILKISKIVYGTRETPIYALEVYEVYRGKGNGKKSFIMMEEELKRLGFSIASLRVFEKNEVAIKLYDSLGYKQVSRIIKKEIVD